jgi:amidase
MLLISEKRLSPTELLHELRNRIETINPTINAFVTLDWERVFEEASRLDQGVSKGMPLGILHGLPVAVKDLTRTKGMRTTFGSSLFANYVPEEDEARAAAIRSSGGIIVGKTNTPEFGAGANTFNSVFGPTLNPFNPKLSVAGSSGGSAAALSASLVPLATGSDMGGSLRTPASFCGVVGFRPSPGIVAAENSYLAWSPLAVEGPMARNVKDVALLLAGMSSDRRPDPLARSVDEQRLLELCSMNLSNVRIALSVDLGFAPVAQTQRKLFRERMRVLEEHGSAIAWDEPDLGDADFIFETIRAVHFLATFSSYSEVEIGRMSENIQSNLADARRISAHDVARAYSEQTQTWRRAQEFFTRYDVLITPAAAVSPFPVEERYPRKVDDLEMRNYIQWFGLGFGISIIAHPAVCLPCGRDSAGMPFGIQIVGPFGEDLKTLRVASSLEELFGQYPEMKRPTPCTSKYISNQTA